MTRPRTALVAGGGIAGAATALALQKAGIEPTMIVEARAGRADGEGAFLTLGSNGFEALRQLDADASRARRGLPDAGDDAAQLDRASASATSAPSTGAAGRRDEPDAHAGRARRAPPRRGRSGAASPSSRAPAASAPRSATGTCSPGCADGEELGGRRC